MSTVLSPASVSTPHVEACWRCGDPCPSDFKADPHLCPACQRMTADMALHEAMATIRALRLGLAPFDGLTPAERAEQLATLIDTGNPAARSAVASLSDDQLIDTIATGSDPEQVGAAAAELTDRLDRLDGAPDPVERRRIELEDEQYHRELTMQREAEAEHFHEYP